MTIAGWWAISIGTALLAIAAYGVLRLPDSLTRQHAATKAATLGLGVMILGLALQHPTPGWLLRLAVLAVVLVLTVPLASHALARAAAGTRGA
jgi:multicomponent Na+:H+ antiporter subunit G